MNEGSILVVDDDREIVRSIAIHLEKKDIRCYVHTTAWKRWTW